MTSVSRPTTGGSAERRRSLADRKQRVTRDAVVDAVIETIGELGLDFSVQDAADRAGVTHRTIYRYFPSRQALVDAVAERYEEWMTDQGATDPATIEEALVQVETVFSLFDQNPDVVRTHAMRVLAGGERPPLSRQRTERWRHSLVAELPHLAPEDVEPLFAICRTFAGSVGWYLLTSQFGLTGQQSGRAVRRLIEVVIADLRRQEEAAARAAASGRAR